MPTPTARERILGALQDLPDDATWADAEERLRFLASVEQAEQEIARGEGIPHEEAKKRINEWLQKLSGPPAH